MHSFLKPNISISHLDWQLTVFYQSKANSISPNKFQHDFHFNNKLFNVVLDCAVLIKRKLQSIQR